MASLEQREGAGRLNERMLTMPQAGENHQKVSTNTKSVSKTLAILSSFNERTPTQRTSDIAAKLHMNISTVSRHLSSLYRSGLVSMEKGNGRVCYYTINRKGLRRLLEVLDQVFLEEPSGPQEEEIQESLSVPGDETG